MATSSNIVEFVGEGALEANRGKGTSKLLLTIYALPFFDDSVYCGIVSLMLRL